MCGIVGFVGSAKREGKVFQNIIEKSVNLLNLEVWIRMFVEDKKKLR